MSRQSFLDPEAVAGAAVGDVRALSAAEARHAQVKRIAVGEAVDVVDGAGLRFVCSVANAQGDSIRVRVDAVIQESLPVHPTVLVQALAKNDRDLQALETCVEIGVDAVVPWQADRSIVRWKAERAAKAHQKWEHLALAATKQSRRTMLTRVLPLATSKQLTQQVAATVQAGGLVLVLHEEAAGSVPAAVDAWLDTEPPVGAQILLVVGPEGGISPQEVQALAGAGAVPVLVGSHILRASTAGAVGLVLVRQALGAYDA